MLKTKSLAQILAPIQKPLSGLEDLLSQQVPESFSLLESLSQAVAAQKGKRLRPALVFLSGGVCGPIKPEHQRLAILTESIHTASLIHDDIIDGSSLRRGKPSFPAQWGSAVSVVFGDFLFSVAFNLTETFASAEIRKAICQSTRKMCEGELLQHEFRKLARIPTREEYLRMVDAKTAQLLSACCRGGAIAGGADADRVEALARYGSELGMAFQIVDDCLDLLGEEGKMGKSLGTDISTGKLTLPLLIALEGNDTPGTRELLRLLQRGGTDLKREEILPLLEAQGAVEQAYQEASRYAQSARDALAGIPASAHRDAMVELSEYVVVRDH